MVVSHNYIMQVMDLKENEVGWVADHMGHTTQVHHKYYKLPSDTLEITKIGKMLLALEKGSDKYSGKTLDSIEVELSD